MNPKLRSILIGIGLLTLVIIAIVLIPRGLSLYYQSRGGQQIDYVLRSVEGIQELVCEPLPESNQAAIEEVERGIEDLQRAVRFNRRSAQSYFHLGKAYCLLGEPDEALKHYQQYTELRPDNPLGYIGLGFAYEAIEDSEKSKNAWIKAGLEPHEFNAVGDEYFRVDNYDNAMLWYERALLINAASAESWMNIGEAYDAMKDYEKALQSYEQAWKYDPEMGTPSLISSYKRNGDLNAVNDILQQMLEKYPKSPDSLLWFQELGSSYSSRGDYYQAVELYTQAIKEYPEQSDLLISLGWAAYERGDDVDSVRNYFDEAIFLDPEGGAGYYAVGQLLNREEKFSEAETWLRRASDLEPDNKWYAIVYGNAARSAGNLGKAIEIYEGIISNNPNYDLAYLEVAVVYNLLNRYQEAMSAIKNAISLAASPDEWYFVRAGTIFANAGEVEIATQYYYQALAINPSNPSAIIGLERINE